MKIQQYNALIWLKEWKSCHEYKETTSTIVEFADIFQCDKTEGNRWKQRIEKPPYISTSNLRMFVRTLKNPHLEKV